MTKKQYPEGKDERDSLSIREGIDAEKLELREKSNATNGTDARNLTFNLRSSWLNTFPQSGNADIPERKALSLLRERFNAQPFTETNKYQKIIVGGNDAGESVASGLMTVSNSTGGFSSMGYDTGIQPKAPFVQAIVRVETHSGTLGTSGEAADVHVGFIKDSDNMVLGGYNTAGNTFQGFEKTSSGGTDHHINQSSVDVPSGKFDMMVGLAGDEVYIAYRDLSQSHPDWEFAGYTNFDFASNNDLYDKTVFDDFSLCWRIATAGGQTVEISEISMFHGMGATVAGPNPLTYPDGAPYIRDNRMYFSINGRPGANRGKNLVCSMDIDTYDVRLESILWAEVEGSDYISNYVAPHIVLDADRDRWLVLWSGFGNGPSDPKTNYTPNRPVFISKTRRDITSGSHRLKCEPMNLPRNGPSHDPYLIFDDDAGKWRLAYNADLMDELQIAETENDTLTAGWSVVASKTDGDSSNDMEGSTICRINGQYVHSHAMQNATNKMVWTDYPDLSNETSISLDRAAGDPDAPWPTVVALPDDGDQTKYVLLTMDDCSRPNSASGAQGSFLVYEADQRADGYEYDHRSVGRPR